MDKSKLKNLILILLMLVNVFLLILVVSNENQAKAAKEYREHALRGVFSQQGISLADNIDLSAQAPEKLSLRRDLGWERRSLSAIIGKLSVEDMGGNIFYYEGEHGQASFSGTGEFKILVDSGIVEAGGDPISSARATMRKLGYGGGAINADIEETSDSTIVTLCCARSNYIIYNAVVSFDFSPNFTIISGRRPLDIEVPDTDTNEYLDCNTALMNFLEHTRQSGEICTRIDSVEIGYIMETAVSGVCTVHSVWHISADTGEFYINAATGRWERPEDYS